MYKKKGKYEKKRSNDNARGVSHCQAMIPCQLYKKKNDRIKERERERNKKECPAPDAVWKKKNTHTKKKE